MENTVSANRSILRKWVKEDRVQKSHFSEDEALMTIQLKNYSKPLLFRVTPLLMNQCWSRLEKQVSACPLSFKQFRNCPRSTMAVCSHEVMGTSHEDDIPISLSGRRIYFPEPNLPAQAYVQLILNWKMPPQCLLQWTADSVQTPNQS